MQKCSLQAFVVTSNDAHNSEYVADHDKRIQFLTGFSGEAGIAVITHSSALLWTDSRFYIQASKELSFPWSLMKQEPSVPSPSQWIGGNVAPGSTVGVDPCFLTFSAHESLLKAFKKRGLTLSLSHGCSVDQIWEDQPRTPRYPVSLAPAYPCTPVIEHPLDFSGQSAAEKLSLVLAIALTVGRYGAKSSRADAAICSFSYALVDDAAAHLFVDPRQLPKETLQYLERNSIQAHPYGDIRSFIQQAVASEDVKLWVDPSQCTMQLLADVPADLLDCSLSYDRVIAAAMRHSPVAIKQSVKNATEQQGMREAHRRDGVAMVKVLHWLESQSTSLTEMDISDKIAEFHSQQPENRGLSFPSIVAGGANAAIVHYGPSRESNYTLQKDDILLMDTGGQYLHGTTDVTRTICLGTPNAKMVEMFTRVLKGHIAFATAKLPIGGSLAYLDSLARQPLFDSCHNYGHGTSHGVGSHLCVHESSSVEPPFLSPGITTRLQVGMVLTDEPGFYEENEFGIRIESQLMSVPAACSEWMQFENLTVIPLQPKMIDPSLLTEKESRWCIDYNQHCYDVLSEFLENSERAWLRGQAEEMRSRLLPL